MGAIPLRTEDSSFRRRTRTAVDYVPIARHTAANADHYSAYFVPVLPWTSENAALQISAAHLQRTVDHLDAALTMKGVDADHRSLTVARVNALRRHITAD